jgi:hypothetical protein
MKTKPFNELRKKMTPEQQVESEMQANLALLKLTLSELRESLGHTQSDVAKNMGVVQSALSKLSIRKIFKYLRSLDTLNLLAEV